MRLLKHQNTPEPGRWHWITPKKAKAWRQKVSRNLATKPRGSVIYEYDTARTVGLERAPVNEAGQAVVEAAPARTDVRDPRETVQVLIEQYLEWVRSAGSKDVLRKRVELIQKSGKLTHLTVDEAVDQIHNLTEKLARADAERVYRQYGFDGQKWRSDIGDAV